MKSYSRRNRLLLAVPARHLKVLMEDFEFIRCQREQILLDADSSLDHVFFPESGVVSVVAVYADGNIIEMATIAGKVAPECRPFSARRRPQRGCWFKFLAARRGCLAPRSIAR
jgi:CRP-like cAMP-binding protein